MDKIKILNSIKDFSKEVFGESIFAPVYKSLAGTGAVVLVFKILLALIELLSDFKAPEIMSGPIVWQVFVSVLVLVSHGQKNYAECDQINDPTRYWVFRIVEALSIIASFGCVGLIVVYSKELLPFVFFSLSFMLLSIIFRRLLTDSLEPHMQILRFISACWFLWVGRWVYLHEYSTNTPIELISYALFVIYLMIIFKRIQSQYI